MGEYFEVKFNNKEIIGKLTELSKKFSMTPFLKIIRVKLLKEIDENFATEGVVSGEKWKEWSKKYRIINFGNDLILNLASELRRSYLKVLAIIHPSHTCTLFTISTSNFPTKNSSYDELIGWGGRIRTSEMAGPKPAALPLGDAPIFFRIYILVCSKKIVNNFL